MTHTLIRAGRPRLACTSDRCRCTQQPPSQPQTGGHAHCTCGAVSPRLDSRGARKRWFEGHVEEEAR